MTRNDRKRLGAGGEAIVEAHLEGLGWRILARNYRCRAGEIDLIAEEATAREVTLVFVEVKTRRGKRHGSPIEAVDYHKRQKLVAVAQYYLGQRNSGGEEPSCRFDVAEVFVGPDALASVSLRRAAFSVE
jgi:putative endonuclease